MNRNPWKARLARHEKRYPVPIDHLQRQAYAVLQIAYEDIGQDDHEARRKAILAYFQALGVYRQLLESGEFERRLQEVEAMIARNGHALRP
jgi:hypothetical protein